MGNIVLLDDLTINKIAAGEVIERPASVIKEMIENSIDAGATNITVEIEKGGISYIKVADNGKGISEDDLDMAFERHATSKIRSADDLDTVTSMGFRGEALASICAIARVELVSKTAEQQNGYKVLVEGGNILDKSEVGCPTGTSITVTNLFFNTPVRYKFLKKDFTEAGYIEDAISRVALVHPEVSLKLINSGKTVIQTNGNGDLKTVIYSIYGKDVANALIEADYIYGDLHIKGVVGKPEIARSNRAYQMFFVNKRYIKDKSLSASADKAYKGMLPLGKFSFLVLNIEMDPSKVDVNVHPAKLEVRFAEEDMIFKAVYHTIKNALAKEEMPTDVQTFENTVQNTKTDTVEFVRPTKSIETLKNVEPSINKEETLEHTKVLEPVKGETIVEQIFRARQLADQVQAFSENKQNDDVQKTNNVEVSEIEKGQEVLRKLQEIKQKLIQENEKIEEIDAMPNLSEQTENEITEIQETPKEPEKIEITEIQETPKEPEKIEITEIQETPKEPEIVEIKEIEEIPEESEIVEIKEFQEIPEEQEAQETLKEPETEYKLETTLPETGYSKEFEEMYLKLFGTKPMKAEQKESKIIENEEKDIETLGNTSMFDNIKEYQKTNYKFIGIIFGTYIIIEIEKEMYIIDQHSAHEKILFEKLKSNYYNDEQKDSQLMLLPDIITLQHKEMQIAKDNMQMFRKAGFIIEEFGENTIKLTGVPEMCLDLETKDMFIEILNEIDSVSRNAKQEIEKKFIETIANKVAEKANIALTKEEVDNLMNDLLQLPNPFVCPCGKSVAIKMSKYDIERKFARK